jgi:deazaflavin-dependent oxidoreductase (nitroreductase family)
MIVRRPEAAFYYSLNALVAPWVRAGFGSPGPLTAGLIVVETVGRRSGRALPVPLIAWPAGRALVVSTVRGDRSQWVKNLSAHPSVRYWQYGRQHAATATVIRPEQQHAHARSPQPAHGLAAALQRSATCSGLTFALLTPDASGP